MPRPAKVTTDPNGFPVADSLIELSTEERHALSSYCARRELVDGENLYRVGDPADVVYFVAEGTIALYFEGEDWMEVIGHMGRKSTVGGTALLYEGPRSTNACAVGSTTVWGFKRDAFKVLRESNPRLAHRLVHELTRQACADLRAVNGRIEVHLTSTSDLTPTFDDTFAAESEWWESTAVRRRAISRLWHSDLD